MKIAHIINPFNGSEEQNNIQNITFESLKRALEYAKNVKVEIIASHFKSDENTIPSFVNTKVVLGKSVLDYNPNLKQRALPTINDILAEAIDKTEADYIVFTNIDIGLMENFYEAVAEIVEQGNDAFTINRRRVSGKYQSASQLNEIYSDAGYLHNGYDCFVFKKELFNQFQLGTVCIGIPHVGNTLFFNLMCFANNFRLFTNKHLTFHVGLELVKTWGEASFLSHNKIEYLKVIAALKNKLELKNVPGAGLPFFKRHLKWLMNPTIHYPTIASLDFKGKGPRYQQTEKKPKGYFEWLQKKIKLD